MYGLHKSKTNVYYISSKAKKRESWSIESLPPEKWQRSLKRPSNLPVLLLLKFRGFFCYYFRRIWLSVLIDSKFQCEIRNSDLSRDHSFVSEMLPCLPLTLEWVYTWLGFGWYFPLQNWVLVGISHFKTESNLKIMLKWTWPTKKYTEKSIVFGLRWSPCIPPIYN